MRQAINVLIIPYRIVQEKIQYAVFKRSDGDVWQGIAGGVEEGESSIQAAKRELEEEIAFKDARLMVLESQSTMPKTIFSDHAHWSVYVVKEICFGVEIKEDKITLSREHQSYEWLSYDLAHKRLTFDSNKTALWEINERIMRDDYETV